MNPELPADDEVLDNPYQYTELQVRQHARCPRLGVRRAGSGDRES